MFVSRASLGPTPLGHYSKSFVGDRGWPICGFCVAKLEVLNVVVDSLWFENTDHLE